MNNECDIVSDLLFSYHDDILSKASKELVEEHLEKCEKCKKILEEIDQENNKTNQVKEIDFFKSIKKKINKKNIIILVVIMTLMLVVLFNIQVYNSYKDVSSAMEVYLKDDITDEQIEKIRNKIIEKSNNIELEYVSKERALERFKNNLDGNESFFNELDKQNNIFPASIEIKTDTKIQTIVENIQDMPGINYIKTHTDYNPYESYILYIYKMFKK